MKQYSSHRLFKLVPKFDQKKFPNRGLWFFELGKIFESGTNFELGTIWIGDSSLTCIILWNYVELLLVAYLELSDLLSDGIITIWLHPYYFITASILGFLVNIASVLVVKTTSSLTLKVLGAVRNLGIVGVAVIIFCKL